MANDEGNATTALNAIITALTPLNSDERHRIVGAAMIFLGEKAVDPRQQQQGGANDDEHDGGLEGYSAHARKWMKQHGVTADELEQVFLINDDGTFDIHDAPGASKKEKTLNTYVLTGLGRFLAANDKTFDDALARQFCESIGCYDQANHAATIAKKGSNFGGDKSKGYTITSVGLKRGATLVKELSSVGQ